MGKYGNYQDDKYYLKKIPKVSRLVSEHGHQIDYINEQTKVQHYRRLLHFNIFENANIELDDPAELTDISCLTCISTAGII